MEIRNNEKTQELENTNSILNTPETQSETSALGSLGEFGAFFERALGRTGTAEVNEEELFASLLEQRLEKVSPEAAEFYRTKQAELLEAGKRADGVVFQETAANDALVATVEEGLIDVETAELVKGEAFMAAQLDDKLDVLYDGRGSANDPTIAVSEMEAALFRMREMLDKIEGGEMTAASMALGNPEPEYVHPAAAAAAAAAKGHALEEEKEEKKVKKDKKIEESKESKKAEQVNDYPSLEGSDLSNYVTIALPGGVKGLVSSVEVHSDFPRTDETKIADGIQSNTNELEFKFSKPNKGFDNEAYVVAYLKNNSVETWQLDDVKVDETPDETSKPAEVTKPDSETESADSDTTDSSSDSSDEAVA